MVFNEARDAVSVAAAAQHRLNEADWVNTAPLKVCMAIHIGVAELRESDYFGPMFNRIARLLAAGHGGQTLLSLATVELVLDRLPALVTLRDLGENRLKDLARPERIYELVIEGLNTQIPHCVRSKISPIISPFNSPLLSVAKNNSPKSARNCSPPTCSLSPDPAAPGKPPFPPSGCRTISRQHLAGGIGHRSRQRPGQHRQRPRSAS